MDEFEQEFRRDIEKYWRDKFADEIDSSLMNMIDDEPTKWFNQGMKNASNIVRYGRDE